MSRFHSSALTLCLVVFAGVARAQDAAVVQLNWSLKSVRQGSSGLELKPTKATINAKKVFEECTNLVPTSKQGMFFGNECGSNTNGVIAAYDKGTGTAVSFGSVNFNFAQAVETTSQGGTFTKTLTVPFTISLLCVDLEVTGSGIAQIGFKGLEGTTCMSSLKLKFTGLIDSAALGIMLADDGSSITSTGSAIFIPGP